MWSCMLYFSVFYVDKQDWLYILGIWQWKSDVLFSCVIYKCIYKSYICIFGSNYLSRWNMILKDWFSLSKYGEKMEIFQNVYFNSDSYKKNSFQNNVSIKMI